MFVTLVRQIDNQCKNNLYSPMPKPIVYLLCFNTEVLFPSMNITTLWQVLRKRCEQDNMPIPTEYHTVRRRIVKTGKYEHEPRQGWKYVIIQRELLRKQPAQAKLPFNDTVVKQS